MNFGDDPSFANLKNVSEIPSIVFLKTVIISKTGILMKITKNLVIIASRFWTRY